MEVSENISWTPCLEIFFKKSAEKAQCYAWLYNHAEQIYSRRRTYIDLPVSVISGLVGFFSVGSSMMFENEQRLSSIALGVASLFVGILNSTKSYFSWDKKSEGCKISSIHYAKLYRFITVELGLPRAERMKASDFLKMTRDTYDRLAETSYPLPPESISTFKSKFSSSKYDDISRPEIANGLEKVSIFPAPGVPEVLRTQASLVSEGVPDELRIRIPQEPSLASSSSEPSIQREQSVASI